MRHTINLLILLCLSSLLIFQNGCRNDVNETNENDSTAYKVPPAKTGNFYATNLNNANAIVLADSISYDVTIKNPDPQDTWTEEDIGRMDEAALANIVLNAIYNGRLTAYNYQTESPMSIKEVKAMETKYPRESVARMRFTEEWYFNENELKFGKRVNAIMIAYEKFNTKGEVRYIPGVKVYLTDESKNPPK
ncbi:MAG: hypothetical protein P1P88_23570 [Bacteroidales bacterium]|nr:hypothetical protein [Bacteroidales bacterium]